MSDLLATAPPCEEQDDLEFPLPFAKLPPELQKAAIASFRSSDRYYDSGDSDFLQENLGEVLTYEFGIEPEYETRKGRDGKSHKGNPKIYWDQYNHVEFEVDDFDIKKVLKHARNDEATVKEFGTCYFKPEAAELAALLHAVDMIEFGTGVEFNASYRLTEGRYSSDRVEWEWEGGHPYPYKVGDDPAYDTACNLFERIDETLKDYRAAACHRLTEVIEAEEEYRYSDEYVQETLDANDHYEFDEEGNLV